ncbi:MAG: hypothetical protein O7J95_05055 [Planctomycetota bacterium]|nr:hypothetical protein [Planctomycetota bacterium]
MSREVLEASGVERLLLPEVVRQASVEPARRCPGNALLKQGGVIGAREVKELRSLGRVLRHDLVVLEPPHGARNLPGRTLDRRGELVPVERPIQNGEGAQHVGSRRIFRRREVASLSLRDKRRERLLDAQRDASAGSVPGMEESRRAPDPQRNPAAFLDERRNQPRVDTERTDEHLQQDPRVPGGKRPQASNAKPLLARP